MFTKLCKVNLHQSYSLLSRCFSQNMFSCQKTFLNCPLFRQCSIKIRKKDLYLSHYHSFIANFMKLWSFKGFNFKHLIYKSQIMLRMFNKCDIRKHLTCLSPTWDCSAILSDLTLSPSQRHSLSLLSRSSREWH